MAIFGSHMTLSILIKVGPQFTVLSIQWQEFPELLCRSFRRIKKEIKLNSMISANVKCYMCIILLIKKALNILHPHYKLSCENKAVLFH